MGTKLTWSLDDEQEYLDHLGSWITNYRQPRISRRALLLNYVEHTSQRQEAWAQDAVFYALKLLHKEFAQ